MVQVAQAPVSFKPSGADPPFPGYVGPAMVAQNFEAPEQPQHDVPMEETEVMRQRAQVLPAQQPEANQMQQTFNDGGNWRQVAKNLEVNDDALDDLT